MPLAEHNGFTLDHLEPSQASSIGPLFADSFHVYEFMRHMAPDTPEARDGWRDSTLAAMKDTTYTIALQVTDPANDNKLVAHGRWVRPKRDGDKEQPGHEDGRWDDVLGVCDQKLADDMFGAYARQREALMGDQPHYYMELLMVHPDYQRKGLGVMIVKYGCDLADRDQVPCYVDGSPRGNGLYEKMGFETRAVESFDYGLKYYFGVREPQRSA